MGVDGGDLSDEEATITFTYIVPELANDALTAFCEEAPNLTSGRRVTGELLDDVLVLSDEFLEEQDQQLLANEVLTLRQDLAAFDAGTGTSFDTGGVNGVIGRLCNLDLESESVG